jgi:hypothetical protein
LLAKGRDFGYTGTWTYALSIAQELISIMPKKSSARHSSAQARPQPKRKDVQLVRSASATEVVEVDEAEETETKAATEASKTAVTKTKATSPAPTGKNTAALAKRPGTTAKPGAQPSRALAASKRGRPGQRGAGRPGPRIAVGRQANLVTAEHYSYVIKDLRLIGILAFMMVVILIALTFILPHVLKY